MKTSDKPISPIVQKYALAISFLNLLCMVITLGIALYDVVQVIAPQFTYVPQQNYVVSEESNPSTGEVPAISLKEEETTRAIQQEKMTAARSLTQAIIILMIDAVLFIIHWQLGNRPVRGDLVAA